MSSALWDAPRYFQCLWSCWMCHKRYFKQSSFGVEAAYTCFLKSWACIVQNPLKFLWEDHLFRDFFNICFSSHHKCCPSLGCCGISTSSVSLQPAVKEQRNLMKSGLSLGAKTTELICFLSCMNCWLVLLSQDVQVRIITFLRRLCRGLEEGLG